MTEHENRHLETHPHALIFPNQTWEEFESLKQSIADQGLIDPIALYDQQILDGRHRYRACLDLDIDPRYDILPLDTDTLAYVIAKNLNRRHLSESQRALIAARMVETERGGDRGNQYTGGKTPIGVLPIDIDKAALLFAVGARSVDRARFILKNGSEETIARIDAGVLTLGAAEEIVRAEVKENVPQEVVIASVDEGVSAKQAIEVAKLPEAEQGPTLEVIKQVKEKGRPIVVTEAERLAKLPKDRQEQVIEIDSSKAKNDDAPLDIRSAAYMERRKNRYEGHFEPGRLPDGQYEILLADPPWKYPQGGVQMDYEAREWYKPMELDEIKAMGVELEGIIAEDAVLYLWTTSTHLEGALAVMEAWGFEYHSLWAWDKERSGLGSRCLHQMEYLLLCTRGSFPPPPEGTLRINLFRGNTGKHSKKPVALYEMIEEQYPRATKLELFARQARDGWDTWGNEVV